MSEAAEGRIKAAMQVFERALRASMMAGFHGSVIVECKVQDGVVQAAEQSIKRGYRAEQLDAKI